MKVKSNSKRIKIENIKNALNTKKGTYMQPMLIDQIRYLQSMLSRADQKPGKDAYIRFEELRKEFYSLKEQLGS